jgi:hypothetical protein
MHSLKKLDPAPTTLIISHDPQVFLEVEFVFALPEGRWMASGDYQEKRYAAEKQPGRRLLADTATGTPAASSFAPGPGGDRSLDTMASPD